MRHLIESSALAMFLTSSAYAIESPKVSEDVLYRSVDVLAAYLEKDFKELSQITKKTSVVHYSQSDSLPTHLQSYLLKKIEHAAAKSDVRFIQCVECLSLKAEAQGEEVFISKGIASEDELKRVLKDLSIQTYGDVNLAYSGRSMALQVSMLDADRTVRWTKEYKTPASSFNDSQWQVGASLEAMSFMKEGMPSPGSARTYVGQRLHGIGAVGLSATLVERTQELSTIGMYGAYFELNHNEYFASYWNYLQLAYQAEVGITDFNGRQQLTESLGVKAKFGQYFTMRLAARTHQFFQTPTDSGNLFNANGEPILRNNEALPTQFIMGIGVEVL
jgi:hypothetical protein